jgi:hypothetical protein
MTNLGVRGVLVALAAWGTFASAGYMMTRWLMQRRAHPRPRQ